MIYLRSNSDDRIKYSALLNRNLEEAKLGDLKFTARYHFGFYYEEYFKTKMRAHQCQTIEAEIFEVLVPEKDEKPSSYTRRFTYEPGEAKNPCLEDFKQLVTTAKSAMEKKCDQADEEFKIYEELAKICEASRIQKNAQKTTTK